MKELVRIQVPGAPAGWRLEKKDGYIQLPLKARKFQEKIRSAIRRKLPGFKARKKKEFEIVIHLYLPFNNNFKLNGDPIPDLDHTATLILNSLKGIIFEDDIQVSGLVLNRWKVSEEPRTEIIVFLL